MSNGSRVNWVVDLLPDDIPRDICPSVRAFFYNQETGWFVDASQRRLLELGENLLYQMKHRSKAIKKKV
jgi:hypothetical protein